MPSSRPLRVLLFLSVAAAGSFLASCTWISEENQYYMQRDWQNFRDTEWLPKLEEFSGLDELWPRPTKAEQRAEQQVCLHPNGDNRVVLQDGISDEVRYRHCVLAPYGRGKVAPGQRLVGRPVVGAEP